jgi:YbbR domain-containing protein
MPRRQQHHRFFTHDLWRKLVALCFALLVWKQVDMQLRSVVSVQQVKVKVNYDQKKFYLREDSFFIDLEVSTPSKMTQLASELFQIEISLPSSYGHSGIYYPKLRSRHVIKKPLRVNIVNFQPNNLAIPFDIIKHKQVKVHVNAQGRVKSGFELNASAQPETVRVEGPSQIIRNVSEISTEPLQLSDDISTSFSVPLSLITPHEAVKLPPRQVTVNAVVENTLRSASQSFTDLVPGIMLPLRNNLRLASLPEQRISVRLRGLSRSINELKSSQLRPFLDLSDVSQAGKHLAPVRISSLPLGIETEEISPSSIEVELVAMPELPSPAANDAMPDRAAPLPQAP